VPFRPSNGSTPAAVPGKTSHTNTFSTVAYKSDPYEKKVRGKWRGSGYGSPDRACSAARVLSPAASVLHHVHCRKLTQPPRPISRHAEACQEATIAWHFQTNTAGQVRCREVCPRDECAVSIQSLPSAVSIILACVAYLVADPYSLLCQSPHIDNQGIPSRTGVIVSAIIFPQADTSVPGRLAQLLQLSQLLPWPRSLHNRNRDAGGSSAGRWQIGQPTPGAMCGAIPVTLSQGYKIALTTESTKQHQHDALGHYNLPVSPQASVFEIGGTTVAPNSRNVDN